MSDRLAAIRHKRARLHREYKQFNASKYWERIEDFVIMEMMAQQDLACSAASDDLEMQNARAMVRALRMIGQLPRRVFETFDEEYHKKELEEEQELANEKGDSPNPAWGEGSDSDPGA